MILLGMSVFSSLMKFPNSLFKTKNIWRFLIYFSLYENMYCLCFCHWKISCNCFGSYLCVCRIVANQNKVLLFELVFSFEFSFIFILFFKVLSLRFGSQAFLEWTCPSLYFISLFVDTICCWVQQQSITCAGKKGGNFFYSNG